MSLITGLCSIHFLLDAFILLKSNVEESAVHST